MPYGKSSYRRSRKAKPSAKRAVSTRRRRTYRPKTYRPTRSLRNKWIAPISQSGKFKFIYADTGFSTHISVASGYTGTYSFRGNGPYDPDVTGVGVQPYGWDQALGSEYFTSYSCPSSSIRIYFRSGTTEEDVRRLSAIIVPVKVGVAVTDISDLRMLPFHKETMYDNVTESTRGAKLKSYCSTNKLYTDSKAIGLANFAYNAAPSAAFAWFWQIIFTVDGVNDDTDFWVYFDCKIKYYTLVSRSALPNES